MKRSEFIKKWCLQSGEGMGRAQFDFSEQLASDLDAVINECAFVPFQTCPICLGTGQVTASGYSSNVYDQCTVCKGHQIIPMSHIKKEE